MKIVVRVLLITAALGLGIYLAALCLGVFVRYWMKNAETVLPPMEFVHMPKGTFYMGGGSRTVGKETKIEQDFEIAIYPVTQELWQAVMGNNPSLFSRTSMGAYSVRDVADADLKHFPVENVSFVVIQKFLAKLNVREQKKGWLYRLPTEAEWEYACRGGATSLADCSFDFYFEEPTNDASSLQANFNGDNPAGKGAKGPYLKRTTKVGSYPANRLGLFDMHGNVWQLCSDTMDSWDRVYRGGNFTSSAEWCGAASRLEYNSESALFHGFRLARVRFGR